MHDSNFTLRTCARCCELVCRRVTTVACPRHHVHRHLHRRAARHTLQPVAGCTAWARQWADAGSERRVRRGAAARRAQREPHTRRRALSGHQGRGTRPTHATGPRHQHTCPTWLQHTRGDPETRVQARHAASRQMQARRAWVRYACMVHTRRPQWLSVLTPPLPLPTGTPSRHAKTRRWTVSSQSACDRRCLHVSAAQCAAPSDTRGAP